jgi:hypothetical protein
MDNGWTRYVILFSCPRPCANLVPLSFNCNDVVDRIVWWHTFSSSQTWLLQASHAFSRLHSTSYLDNYGPSHTIVRITCQITAFRPNSVLARYAARIADGIQSYPETSWCTFWPTSMHKYIILRAGNTDGVNIFQTDRITGTLRNCAGIF